jgi:hypothetical protein
VAEEAANTTGLVIVVNMQARVDERWLSTDSTDATLRGEESCVLVGADPVLLDPPDSFLNGTTFQDLGSPWRVLAKVGPIAGTTQTLGAVRQIRVTLR